MQRSSIIATVVAAGGILVAGSVASVAVINAAATNTPEATSVTLVADEEPATESTGELPADTVDVPLADDTAPSALPPVESSTLPSVPSVGSTPSTRDSTREDEPQGQATPTRSAKPTASSKPQATQEAQQDPSISADQARSIVLAEGKGVAVVSVSKAARGGLQTWAVRIQRSNGEELTGYVDRASGVVVDWVVNAGPTPVPQPSQSAGDDDSDDDKADDNSGTGSDDESDDDSDDDNSGTGSDDDRDEDYDDDGKDDDD